MIYVAPRSGARRAPRLNLPYCAGRFFNFRPFGVFGREKNLDFRETPIGIEFVFPETNVLESEQQFAEEVAITYDILVSERGFQSSQVGNLVSERGKSRSPMIQSSRGPLGPNKILETPFYNIQHAMSGPPPLRHSQLNAS